MTCSPLLCSRCGPADLFTRSGVHGEELFGHPQDGLRVQAQVSGWARKTPQLLNSQTVDSQHKSQHRIELVHAHSLCSITDKFK